MRYRPLIGRALMGSLIACVAAPSVAQAQAQFGPAPGRSDNTVERRQQLISRAADGGMPNGPVLEPTISGDARIGRYVAYSSTATNIAGTTNGRRNIFLVSRGGNPGKFGTPWKYGSTALASPGRGGPANGDSFTPALGGWTNADTAMRAKCLVFVSQASNLVEGDTNSRADAFIRKLPDGKLRRIKSPAAVSEVAVSSDCRTVAVIAGGSLYVKRTTSNDLRKLDGDASSPILTFNGLYASYVSNGKVLLRRVAGGGARTIATGSNPSFDVDAPGGRVRRVAYERGGSTYNKRIGGAEKRMAPASSLPAMSGGGGQALFAYGRFAYLWTVKFPPGSSIHGTILPKGFCPTGQGAINGLDMSARGNYSVLSCTGGAAYLYFLGGK